MIKKKTFPNQVADVSKRSSELWKALDVNERAKWDAISNEDKQRYMIEKEKYTGPWQVYNNYFYLSTFLICLELVIFFILSYSIFIQIFDKIRCLVNDLKRYGS